MTALHEPDRSIAKVVGFLGAYRRALRPEQGLGNCAVGWAGEARVDGAQCVNEAVAALGGQLAEIRG